MNNKINIEKIAVLGLDGLSWDFLQTLIDYGVFTEVKYILTKSFKSILHAYPPSSFPSWSSILTGVNPGKHGIFSFDYLDKQTLTQRLYTTLDLEHPRIHEMLAMNKVPCIMLNPIPAYPMIPIRNVKMISHMFFTPKTTYYPESMKKYASMLGEPPKPLIEGKIALLDMLYNLVERYSSVIDELMDKEWKVFWVNLNIPDRIHHKLPKVLLKKKINVKVAKIFATINKIVKKLRKASDVLIILSDHGFSVYRTLISINDFLTKKGYAKVAVRTENALKEHKEIILKEKGMQRKIKYIKVNPALRLIFKPFKPLIKKAYKLLTGAELRSLRLLINPKDSIAFLQSHSSFGIYVKERALISRVKEELLTLNGLKWVKERESVFHGPYISRAPNLLLYPDFERGFTIADNKVYGQVLLKTKSVGHSPFGVFILYYSSDILGKKAYAETAFMENYYVTPIIMYLSNTPLSHMVDNVSILEKLFEVRRLKYRNYVALWNIVKRLSRVKKSIK